MSLPSPRSSSILEHFAALRDPREGWRVPYPLREILLVVLCATLCGMDDFVEVKLWGEARLDVLRRFLPFERGIPSHDTLNDVMNGIDADLFKLCFAGWVDTLRDGQPDIVAVVLRQAQDEGQDVAPLPRPGQGAHAAPPRVGLGGPSAPGARPGGDRRQVQRDHRNPAVA